MVENLSVSSVSTKAVQNVRLRRLRIITYLTTSNLSACDLICRVTNSSIGLTTKGFALHKGRVMRYSILWLCACACMCALIFYTCVLYAIVLVSACVCLGVRVCVYVCV